MRKKEIKVTAEVGKDKTTVEESLKKGFFKKVWYSITKFEKYPDLAAEGVFAAIKYLISVMIIFGIVVSGAMVYQTSTYVNKIATYVENDLPDFKYSEEKLKFESEEPIIEDKTDLDLGLLIIDTSINSSNEEDKDKIDDYKVLINNQIQKSGTIIMEDKTIVVLADKQAEYSYSDLIKTVGIDLTEFSKSDAVSYLNSNQMASLYGMYFVVMFIYVFIIYLASVVVDAAMLSVIGFITTLCAKLKMKFAAIFNMSIYALTLSIIFSIIYTVVNLFTTFEIQYFQVMYVAIAYIYLAAAIFIIKSDFVKKQAELQKVNEEQKRVREELSEQEDKKENKEEKDNKKQDGKKEQKEGSKKENKEKKQKQDKDNNLGDTPEESNA